jgi:hypothetical protein
MRKVTTLGGLAGATWIMVTLLLYGLTSTSGQIAQAVLPVLGYTRETWVLPTSLIICGLVGFAASIIVLLIGLVASWVASQVE